MNGFGGFGSSVDVGVDTVFIDGATGIEKLLQSYGNRHTHLPSPILLRQALVTRKAAMQPSL
jgi:hypothetical protein